MVKKCFVSFGSWSSTSSPLHVSSWSSSSGTAPEPACHICCFPTGPRCYDAVVVELHPLGSRQTLCWNSCASVGSLSCIGSAADSSWFPPRRLELDHQLPPREISTWRSTLLKSALNSFTPCFHVRAKNELVCESLVDTTFEMLGEHEWRKWCPKMNARVNVTNESAPLPLWSGCPPRPSSTGSEPTMLQATWREQAHRARSPLRLTCFAAAWTGPRSPSRHITLCWAWNQSDVEEKCKCASLSSVRTTLKQHKKVTHFQMLLKQAQLRTTLKRNDVALEYYNMFEAH